jgi:hypothetical protein
LPEEGAIGEKIAQLGKLRGGHRVDRDRNDLPLAHHQQHLAGDLVGLDERRYAAAFRYVLHDAFRRVRVLGGIFALLGILLIVGPADVWPLGVALVVVGALFALVMPGKSIRASVRNLPLALRQPQRIEVTDQAVRVASPLISMEYAWGGRVRLGIDDDMHNVLLAVGAIDHRRARVDRAAPNLASSPAPPPPQSAPPALHPERRGP